MRNPLLAPEVRELLSEGKGDDLVQVIQDLHPNDAAAILSALEPDEVVQVMSLLPVDLERDVFAYLEPQAQDELVLGSGRERVKELLASIPSDDRAEFLDRLDLSVRNQLYPLLSKAAREDLLRRSQFEDDQVGSKISTEYCVLNQNLTTVQAISVLRRQAPTKETIYYSYVVDRDGKLIGFVSLRDLLVAPDAETVGETMRTEMVRVHAEDDQEDAARLIREYDLLALPVVDETERLVGIVTHDDAEDIIEEEVTEDVELMAGLTGETTAEGYIAETVASQVRRRIPVIAFAACFSFCTAVVIGTQIEKLPEVAVLVALLPMVMATGGSVGTQASSLVIRNLTIGQIDARGLIGVFWKEMRVSLVMAVVLGAIVFAEAILVPRFLSAPTGDQPAMLTICWVLAGAMALHVVTSAVLGAVVPVVVQACKGDPATISAPVVTAFADLSGAAIYLLLGLVYLG